MLLSSVAGMLRSRASGSLLQRNAVRRRSNDSGAREDVQVVCKERGRAQGKLEVVAKVICNLRKHGRDDVD